MYFPAIRIYLKTEQVECAVKKVVFYLYIIMQIILLYHTYSEIYFMLHYIVFHTVDIKQNKHFNAQFEITDEKQDFSVNHKIR